MRKDTKLARIREAMSLGDWDSALRLAAKFQRLGEHADAIRRAADSLANPVFYEELGYDLEQLRAEGIDALKARYSASWSRVAAKASSSTAD